MTRKGNLRQSDRDAIARYIEKTYKQFAVKLRKDEDADIISALDDAHDHGISSREIIRSWYEAANEKQSI